MGFYEMRAARGDNPGFESVYIDDEGNTYYEGAEGYPVVELEVGEDEPEEKVGDASESPNPEEQSPVKDEFEGQNAPQHEVQV